jgi:hypothetical protein
MSIKIRTNAQNSDAAIQKYCQSFRTAKYFGLDEKTIFGLFTGLRSLIPQKIFNPACYFQKTTYLCHPFFKRFLIPKFNDSMILDDGMSESLDFGNKKQGGEFRRHNEIHLYSLKIKYIYYAGNVRKEDRDDLYFYAGGQKYAMYGDRGGSLCGHPNQNR